MPELFLLANCDFYDDLYILCAHIHANERNRETLDTVGFKGIDSALAANRKTLEESFKPFSKAVNNDTIEDYYGPNLFKCKLARCRLFYQGYGKKAERDDHHNKHKRPFKCTESCSASLNGFPTRRELDRHMRDWHADLSGAPPSSFDTNQTNRAELRFYCEVCPNSRGFTRKENLNSHMRSHFGERPYECSRCQSRFTRPQELKRHERTHQRSGA
jgi:hypothetical protein